MIILRLIRHLHIRLNIETLPDLPRVHRQRLLTTARPARMVLFAAVFTSRARARDRRHRAVPVVRAVAERHGLQRHAVAARNVFWDVGCTRGAARHVEAAADAEFF